MKAKRRTKGTGAMNLRDVPKDLIEKIGQAAKVEHRTVKGFLLNLAEERIQDLEKRGILPKGKG